MYNMPPATAPSVFRLPTVPAPAEPLPPKPSTPTTGRGWTTPVPQALPPKKVSRPELPHAPFNPTANPRDFVAILSEQYPEPKLLSGKVSSYVKFISSDGDYIGGGVSKVYDLRVTGDVPTQRHGGVEISFDGWGVELAPTRRALGFPLGKYFGATRTALRQGEEPGVNFAGHGRSCNTAKGSFALWELKIEDGKVVALAADFLHRGEGTGPPLYGRVRYRSKYE